MALVRDLALLDAATAIPALQEVMREQLVRYTFIRDERRLPREVVRVLNRSHDVVLKPQDLAELKKLVAVANRSESSVSLGLPAEEYHHFRQRLRVGLDEVVGLHWKPSRLATYDWIVPPQGGILIDPSELRGLEIEPDRLRGLAAVGEPWKAVHDAALGQGFRLPFYPVVPLDFTLGDGLYGDAAFAAYDGPFEDVVYGVRAVNAQGHAVWAGFPNVANHASGYDLRYLALQACTDFFAPIGVSFALRPKPAVAKAIRATFDDLAAFAAAAGRVVASARSFHYVATYDDRAAVHLTGAEDASAPFVLELAYGGTEAMVAARDKALDALLQGATGREEGPGLYGLDPTAHGERSLRLERLVLPGEVRVPTAGLEGAVKALRSYGEQAGAKVGFVGMAFRTGDAALWPLLDVPKERSRVFEVTKAIWELAKRLPDGHLRTRLGALFERDRYYTQRVGLLYRLDEALDAANVMEPAARLAR